MGFTHTKPFIRNSYQSQSHQLSVRFFYEKPFSCQLSGFGCGTLGNRHKHLFN